MLPYVNTDPSAIVSSTPNRPSSDSIICCSGEDNNFFSANSSNSIPTNKACCTSRLRNTRSTE